MIATNCLKKQYGKKVLFEDVTIRFKPDHRYGLIGANGSGKSTFLKILTKQEESSGGEVLYTKDVRIGYLRQDHYAFDEETIIDTVIQGYPDLWKVHSERETLFNKEDLTDEEGIRASELEMEYADLNGYMAESDAGELLEGLGIPSEKHFEKMDSLTGGFKLRVLLARALFGSPELLLLDEPTNHLDIDSIRWLEKFLISYQGTIVVISHDRHFLNSVCSHIADLDYSEIRIYPGNYDEFMQASTEVRDQQVLANERKKKEIAKLQNFVNRFAANASKSKQATSRQKQIDKIELDKIKPSSRKSPFIRFEIGKPCGKKVIELKSISKSYEGVGFVLKDIDFTLAKEDRVAIVGPNGVGKTTLVKSIMKSIKSDKGSVIWGESVDVSYFPQDSTEVLQGDYNLLEWLRMDAPKNTEESDLRGLLGRMLFKKEDALKKISVLSGGEKARLILSRMIMLKKNVIILDEPSNHLDLESIEALNYALEQFDGPILFVSHDRQLVSSVANKIIEIKSGKIHTYLGNYEDYLKQEQKD